MNAKEAPAIQKLTKEQALSVFLQLNAQFRATPAERDIIIAAYATLNALAEPEIKEEVKS